MYLTISKRFKFSASHHLWVPNWSDEQNLSFFGKEAESRFGHGHNYTAFFVFNGPVNEKNGMMINVTIIKKRIKSLLDSRYDHKFLNSADLPFGKLIPTAENVASQLLKDVITLFEGETAQPIACHLVESPISSATAYKDGKVERHMWFDFSAARRTYSPHLSDEENNSFFGIATSHSGHGHHYRVRATLFGTVQPEYGMIYPELEGLKVLDELCNKFDHRNLNVDIPELKSLPITTEIITSYFWDYLHQRIPVVRVRVYENDKFFIECHRHKKLYLGVVSQFHAAHRLHSDLLSEAENITTYGICNNPEGHGHLYQVEGTITGDLDERSGTLGNLFELEDKINTVLDDWNYKHLDLETEDFKNKPSTGENILLALWQKLGENIDLKLHRLRIWETPNNRFVLRESIND